MSRTHATTSPLNDAAMAPPTTAPGSDGRAARGQSAELLGQDPGLQSGVQAGDPAAAQSAELLGQGPRSWNQWLTGLVGGEAQNDAPAAPKEPDPVYTARAYTCTDSAAWLRTAPPEAAYVNRSLPQGETVVVVDEGAASSRRTGDCVEVVSIGPDGALGQSWGWTKVGNLTPLDGSMPLPKASADRLLAGSRPDLSVDIDGAPAPLPTEGDGDAAQPEPAAVAADGIQAIVDMCVGWESWVTWDETVVDAMGLLTGGERTYARTVPYLHGVLAEKLGPADFEQALRNVDATLLDLVSAHLTAGYDDYFSGAFAGEVQGAQLAEVQSLLGMGPEMIERLVQSGVDPTRHPALADPGTASMMSAEPAFEAWARGVNGWDGPAYQTWASGLLSHADEDTRRHAFSTVSEEKVGQMVADRQYRGKKKADHRTRIDYEGIEGGLSASLRGDIYPTAKADDYGEAVRDLSRDKAADMSTGQQALLRKVEEFLATRPEPAGAYAAYARFEVPGRMLQVGETVLDPELIERMRLFVKFAAWAGLLTAAPSVSSGARSEKQCHQLSVNYQFVSGRGINDEANRKQVAEWAVENEGRDEDGNTWIPSHLVDELKAEEADDAVYRKVLLEDVKGTFSRQQTAQAAEGYDRGDSRRMPNLRNTGKSLHAGRDGVAGAIDISIPWVFSNRYDPMIDILALYFGLKRPVKDSSSSPEDWHYEKIGSVLKGDEVDEES